MLLLLLSCSFLTWTPPEIIIPVYARWDNPVVVCVDQQSDHKLSDIRNYYSRWTTLGYDVKEIVIGSCFKQGEITISTPDSELLERKSWDAYTDRDRMGNTMTYAVVTFYPLTAENLIHHEIGHGWGLDHVETSGHIMSPVAGDSWAGLEELRRGVTPR